MADQSELRMNLVAIKRVDPYAKDIVDSSAHVAFYTFSEESEWNKTDVEGAFFIYSRNAEPYHSIFINNRLNTNSLVEPITVQIELQTEAPFLLYRNERSRIRGFWFYNSSDCDRIGALIERLVENCDKNLNYKDIPNTMSSTNQINKKNVDIFLMLTKAQEDFNNSVNGGGAVALPQMPTTTTIEKNPGNADVTPQSVMNFFAAAKQPVYQRMKSQPVPVDQIEKQQRTGTPYDKNNSPPQNANIPMTNAENGFGFMRINSPNHQHHPQHQPELGTSPLANFINNTNLLVARQPAGTCHSTNPTDLSEIEQSQQSHQPLLKKVAEQNNAPAKPTLMLPTMFSVKQQKQKDSSIKFPLKQLDSKSESSGSKIESTKLSTEKPEPLTQSQLLQAMSYLIKNDPDFVKKLHEAYLKSFNEMVSL